MKAFALIGLSIVVVAVAAITSSVSAADSPIAKDPTPAVVAMLKKEANFLNELSDLYASNGQTVWGPYGGYLMASSHLIDSIKRARRQILMGAVRGWQDVSEFEFKLRMDKAVDEAAMAADSRIVEIAKLHDPKHFTDFRSRVTELVKYFKQQKGADWILNTKH